MVWSSLLTCFLQNESLPHLQSLVIVLLKAIIAIASNLVTPGANGQQQAAGGQNNGRANGNAARGQNGANGLNKVDAHSPLDGEADEPRNREIAAKAVTGIMVLLLKWLKLSRMSLPLCGTSVFVYYLSLPLSANTLDSLFLRHLEI